MDIYVYGYKHSEILLFPRYVGKRCFRAHALALVAAPALQSCHIGG